MEVKINSGVAEIDFYHSPMNSLDIGFLKQLNKTMKKIERNSTIYGVVFTSTKHALFSSGLELRSLYSKSAFMTKLNVMRTVHWVYKTVKFILRSKKIYIAAMDGAVIGSAVSIIMACDYRLASEKTWFWLPDPQYGGLLADGGIDLLNSTCGLGYTKLIGMTNQRFDASWALKVGMIHEITKEKVVRDQAILFMKRFANYSKETLFLTKKICNRSALGKFHFKELFRVVNSKEMKQRLEYYLKQR